MMVEEIEGMGRASEEEGEEEEEEEEEGRRRFDDGKAMNVCIPPKPSGSRQNE